MKSDLLGYLAVYAALIGGYAIIAIVSAVLSRQSRPVILIAAIAALGFALLIAKGRYGGYSEDFVLGNLAGACLGVAAVLGLAARLSRRR